METDRPGLQPLLHLLIIVALEMLWPHILQCYVPQGRLEVTPYQHFIGIEGDRPQSWLFILPEPRVQPFP